MGTMPRWAGRIARAISVLLLLTTAAASAAETAKAKATPALWRVQHGASTVYLFGSFHVLPRDFAWRTPEIDAAMAASDRFYFEVPVDEEGLKEEKEFIVQYGILSSRQTLRNMLSPGEFQTYSVILRRAGLKPLYFERYRPWLASVMVGLAYLHPGDLTMLRGADDEIMAFAREHGRPLLYLENIEDQMKLLTTGDESSQLKALKNLIISLRDSRDQEKILQQAWASGDAKSMSALLDGYFAGHPAAQDVLIDSRNRNWLPAIREALGRDKSTTMMTVGVAHIGGRKGLVALLCSEGYKVERVGTNQDACGPEA
jgi:uncharacterized protein YbaP (TraB family)